MPFIPTQSQPTYVPNVAHRYTVGTFRAAGLQAKWTKNHRGAPIIIVRNPNAESRHQRECWWMCDRSMWETMQRVGILEGFDSHTLLGDVFSVPG